MTHQLDTFEAQLLTQLRSTVAARALQEQIQEQEQPTRRRHRWSRPALVSVAAAAAAVAVAVAAVVPGLGSSPAYAVQDGPVGSVTVTVHRLEDSAALEQDLSSEGISASVQYLKDGLGCAPGRYTAAAAVDDSLTSFTVGTNGITVVIDRRDVAAGQTVVITASRIRNGVHAEVGVAEGVVKDCVATPLSGSHASS